MFKRCRKVIFLALALIILVLSAFGIALASDNIPFLYYDSNANASTATYDGLEVTDHTDLYCDGLGNCIQVGSVTLKNTNEQADIDLSKIELIDISSTFVGSDYGVYTVEDTSKKISFSGTLGNCSTSSVYKMVAGESITLNISYSDIPAKCADLIEATKVNSKFCNLNITHTKYEPYAVVRDSSTENSNATNDLLEFRYDGNRSNYSLTFDCLNTGTNSPDWAKYIGGISGSASTNTVTSVNFTSEFTDNVKPKSFYKWFAGYSTNIYPQIEFAGIENLDTSSVTNMSYMFYNCNSTSTNNSVPDVSNFDTSKVIDMSYMFANYGYNSTILEYIPAVDNWNVQLVQSMSHMFENYAFYSQVLNDVPNVNNWFTPQLQDASYLFADYAENSTVLNVVPAVSNWCTDSVTNMDSLFYCYGYYSTKLKQVPDVATKQVSTSERVYKAWVTNNVESMVSMFNCYARTSSTLSLVPDVSNWDTSNLKSISKMFRFYGRSSSVLSAVPDLSTKTVTSISPSYEAWNTSNLENTSNLFRSYAYQSRYKLNKLDLSGWDISSINNTQEMFQNDTGTTVPGEWVIYTTDWTSQKASISTSTDMFTNEYNRLRKSTTYTNWNGANTSKTGRFYPKQGIVELSGDTGIDHFEDTNGNTITYGSGAGADTIRIKPVLKNGYMINEIIDSDGTVYTASSTGYFSIKIKVASITVTVSTKEAEAYACWTTSEVTNNDSNLSANSLNFFYDDNKSAWEDKGCTAYNMNTEGNAPDWSIIASSCESINFDESFNSYQPTTCYRWFRDFNNANLISIDLSNLNTSKVTSMISMFYGCTNVVTFTFPDDFGTAVINTDSMFDTCSNLTTLILPDGFGTAITTANQMFTYCSNLTTLTLPNGFGTTIAEAGYMFIGDYSLISIYCNTDMSTILTYSREMFTSCSKLPHYSSVSERDKTYAYPDNGVTGYFTPKTPTYSLAKGDTNVTDFLNEDNESITSISGDYGTKVKVKPVFADGYSVDKIVDNAGTEYTLDENGYFEIELKFNGSITVTSKVAAEAYACWTTSEVNSNDTNLAANSLNFFYDGNRSSWESKSCTTYDMNTGYKTPGWSSVGSSCMSVVFDTSFASYQPSSCNYWFSGFNNSAFTTIDFTNLDISQVTNMQNMFCDCSSLTSLDVSGFDTSNVTDMNHMFSGCSGLTSLTLGNLDTNKVSDISAMFFRCSGLTILTLPDGFGSVATDVGYLFAECSTLTTIYCNSDFSNVSSYDAMFASCSNLKGGNGTAYNSSYTGAVRAKPDLPGQVGYFTSPFAVINIGDSTIDATPSGWTSFTEGSTTKYYKWCPTENSIATQVATFTPTFTYEDETYTSPRGGWNPSTGTFTGRQDITAVWSTMNYQVTIWGIGQDRTSDSVSRITFGPATGTSNSCLEVDGKHTHCIHNDSWQTIIDNINAGHADYYNDCLTNGCTKSVPIYYNSTIGTNPTSAVYASVLTTNGGLLSTYRKWNNSYNTSDTESANWATSRMRATLNGYNNSWQSFTPSSYAGTDYLNSNNCLLSCFPKTLQNNVKTKTYTVPTNWSTSSPYTISASTSVQDKLFLFNAMETYSGITSSNRAYYYYSDSNYGTTQYTKKANEGTSTSSYSKNIAYCETGAAWSWWLRCPSRSNCYNAAGVNGSGYLYSSNVRNSNGLSPGFIL